MRIRATRADVAGAAGVSLSTVSHVMNGRAAELRIAPETVQRVQAAAQHLHYIPRASARSFRYATSRTIGLLFSRVPKWNTMPVFQTVLLHAISHANECGYQVMPIPVPDLGIDDVPRFTAQIFGDVEIAGVVCEWFASSGLVGEWLSQAGVPLVWYSTSGIVTDTTQRAVSIEEEPGVNDLLGNLQPRKTTVLLKGPGPNRGRYDVARKHFPGLVELDLAGWQQSDGIGIWDQLVTYADPLVICPNDPVALGVMSAAQRSGRIAPRDLGITGFGDSSTSQLEMANLSTVGWPIAELGDRLITEMMSMLGDGPTMAPPIVLTTTAMPRGSA
ncbi:MAG: LacI family DNA-binding transcriptional regulator [Arachnia sp.]